jgi:predicted amidohydrolase YtcJ
MGTLMAVCTLLSLAASTSGGSGAVSEPADLILHGGRILTLVDPEPVPQPTALAVRSDRIIRVGDDTSVLALAGPATRVVDLSGAVVVPGFCDSHAHLYGLGKALSEIDLVGTRSAGECVARVAAAADAAPAAGWLEGRGWDQNDWDRAEFPDRSLLDAAVKERPVLLRRIDGHAAWVNGAALRRAGIDARTTDPEGGRIQRDAAGEPTGILVDNAIDLLTSALPPVPAAEQRRRIKLAVDHCLRYGLTGMHDAGAPAERIDIYRELAAAGELDLRLYVMLADETQTLDGWLERGPLVEPGGMLTVRAVKLYADGALGSRGALLLADYADEPGRRGLQVTPTDHLREVARRAGEAGFQVCTHAIGDGGNRMILDVYEEVLGQLGLRDARWRIEHAQILHPDDLPRFARLGVVASMQPTHCTSDMDWVEDRLGEARCAGGYAWRSLLDSGAVVCFGTDFPVEDVDPLLGLYAARTRQHPDGMPAGGWHPEQRLDGRQALLLYTRAGAEASLREKELGLIQPGMLADLTVLSCDPVACPPAELLAARVLMTVVAGRVRYQAEGKAGR